MTNKNETIRGGRMVSSHLLKAIICTVWCRKAYFAGGAGGTGCAKLSVP